MFFTIDCGLFKYDLTDYYAILGLPVTCNPQDVRKRYLKIAHRLHPDTCKASSDTEKEQASEILSKLVNPAYENLSKDQSRAEFQLILAQTGKRLAAEAGRLTVASEPANQLYQATSNIDMVYQKLLDSLSKEQYQSIDAILTNIAHISEVNLIYIMLKEGEGIRREIKPLNVSTSSNTSSQNPTSSQSSNLQSDSNPTDSSQKVAPYIRRADEYMQKNNYAKAVLELRDALKLEPNNATAHAWMGLAYLNQQQMGMAKVHINKAWQADPKDAVAIQAKQALDKVMGVDQKSKGSADSKPKGGFFGGLFGGKK